MKLVAVGGNSPHREYPRRYPISCVWKPWDTGSLILYSRRNLVLVPCSRCPLIEGWSWIVIPQLISIVQIELNSRWGDPSPALPGLTSFTIGRGVDWATGGPCWYNWFMMS